MVKAKKTRKKRKSKTLYTICTEPTNNNIYIINITNKIHISILNAFVEFKTALSATIATQNKRKIYIKHIYR